MKDKISTIILSIIFIVLLVVIYNITNKQTLKSNISSNIVNTNTVSLKDTTDINEEESDMEIISVSKDNFEKEVLESDKKVLIDFYADWCGPCKMLSPIVAEFAKENDAVKVVKINIDENEELAIKYGVTSIPTLVVIENGETKDISIGLISKSEIEELVK